MSKNDNYLIEGIWRYEGADNGSEIVFTNGLYSLTKWNDDLVNVSKGKYFFNENTKRLLLTLTLVPDLQYSEGDTIMLPCDNFDILSITDSFMLIKKPTQWLHSTEKSRTKRNITILYRKIKT